MSGIFGIGASGFEPGLARYREGLLDSRLNAVYQYHWDQHVYPAEAALISISLIPESSCGWLNFSVRSCMRIELFDKDVVADELP